ncbi:MAG: NADH-quinone oxidoreductase subunit L [Alphaproteobacteria bacterium]|nr:NADH-quinone oxidoreductase subunit L [Alphaproteobacteria bacterium]
MTSHMIWIFTLGQLALATIGLMPGTWKESARRVALMAFGAALLTLILAGAALGLVLSKGTLSTVTATGICGLYYDPLSASIEVLVAFIGLIVVLYSRNYLDGDPRHGDFLTRLCLTLAAVLHLIVASQLPQFALAWIATSLCLHRLLTFYSERPAAILAARKKFVAARLSDAALVGAFVLLWSVYHTANIALISDIAHNASALAASRQPVLIATILLALAALLKSAQFPMHGWILEVMETPTPVSALLHAGIINAGGFLILRFAPLFLHADFSLDLLLFLGGVTALFGALVMLTQTSVKVSLAYSTIGQMGFMMLECGLGAFPAAWLHIIGHSLYKAHAFLTAGGIVTDAEPNISAREPQRLPPWQLLAVIALSLVIVLLVGAMFGLTLTGAPGPVILSAILVLSVTHLLNSSGASFTPRLLVHSLGRSLLIAVAAFGLQAAAAHFLASSTPDALPLRGPLEAILGGLILSGFVAALFAQSRLNRSGRSDLWRAVYVHLSNGLYVNTVANRWAITLWPDPIDHRHADHPEVNLTLWEGNS